MAVTPKPGMPVVADQHRLGLALHEALGGQHVLDLGGADAEGQRAEGAVGGGVRVAADDRHARLGDAELGPDHVDDALLVGAEAVERDAELRAVGSSVSTCLRLSSSLMSRATGVPSVGVLWSAVASVRSGRRTVRPARRRPSKACGLVTSWTRCRSMNSRPGSDLVGLPELVEQRLGHSLLLTAAQSGRHDGQERRLVGPGVLEVVGQVGVEGDGVAGGQLVALAVDDER